MPCTDSPPNVCPIRKEKNLAKKRKEKKESLAKERTATAIVT
jgi:hypothetical protein